MYEYNITSFRCRLIPMQDPHLKNINRSSINTKQIVTGLWNIIQMLKIVTGYSTSNKSCQRRKLLSETNISESYLQTT